MAYYFQFIDFMGVFYDGLLYIDCLLIKSLIERVASGYSFGSPYKIY